ncbi:glycerophosphodiester phosphodiesterase family protein [Phytoactinopolyspora halotolerans]|uniref:Glycerophosphodiester phosphodiesterase n=1 Tax=Phytoactinopolyspora halotolerans TaxID=1981512 RepID=A0A6L9S8C4_9ACTN|nr:glycerophosphodiester phosphodiesterase family protein [Phytoactinopolyspora halotolerans]NEE00778.1 glycerophosphodiester phosphodiesterase [Phytoactinopolyspora halotolerans]
MTAPRYGSDDGFLAIAHRGGAGLAPENTVAAFSRAYALGYRYLETDVRVTADGVCLAFHDAKLGRVTDGRGQVVRHTWDDVRRLAVGGTEPVARLDDVLLAFPDACFIIDVKDEAAIEPLADVLRRTGAAARVCLAGAWDGWLTQLRAAVGPELTCALGWRALVSWLGCARLRVAAPRRVMTGEFAHVPLRLGRVPVFMDRLVTRAHQRGLRLVVWTVDDPDVMRRLIAAGVDGIITDRPDVLREVMIAEGIWHAPTPSVHFPATDSAR